MSPALTVSEAEMATALRIFGEAVAEVAGHGGEVLAEASAAGALTSVEAGRLSRPARHQASIDR